MNIFGKTFGVSVVAISLLIGVTTGALGQAPGGGSGASTSSGGAKGLVKLRASVVCTNCSLEEAQAAHPDLTDLYELDHEKGKVVIRVRSVNSSAASGENENTTARWEAISQPAQLAVRAEDSIFQKLVDEKNRAKEMEITGILRTTRTLDIAEITVLG